MTLRRPPSLNSLLHIATAEDKPTAIVLAGHNGSGKSDVRPSQARTSPALEAMRFDALVEVLAYRIRCLRVSLPWTDLRRHRREDQSSVPRRRQSTSCLGGPCSRRECQRPRHPETGRFPRHPIPPFLDGSQAIWPGYRACVCHSIHALVSRLTLRDRTISA